MAASCRAAFTWSRVRPGAGKTILASQVLYGHAAVGGRALFVTVLGENHGRMFTHLRPMRFFDPSVIPDKVTYISAYHALDDEGLKAGLTHEIVQVAQSGLAHLSWLRKRAHEERK